MTTCDPSDDLFWLLDVHEGRAIHMKLPHIRPCSTQALMGSLAEVMNAGTEQEVDKSTVFA